MGIARACACVGAGLLAIGIAGCEPDGRSSFATWLSGPEFTAPTATVQERSEVKYFPSDEPLKLALEHFDRGNYGIAERYFRDAVEKAPRDATAWVGLAATYDRLARFDLAAKAALGDKYIPSLAVSVITPGDPGAVLSGATFVTGPAVRLGVQWSF